MYFKPLFSLELLHAFFLDIGDKKYHSTSGSDELSASEKEEVLQIYRLPDFMSIVPDFNTKRLMKNHRMIVRNYSKGIHVLSNTLKVKTLEGTDEVTRFSPIIPIDDTEVLTFYIKANDTHFYNYTSLTEKSNNQLYYLSNISSSASNIFDANSSIEKWEDFLISERESRKLVYDLEKEQEFNANIPKLVTISSIEDSVVEAIEDKVENNQALTETETEIFNYLNTAVKLLKNSGVVGVVRIKIAGDNSNDLTEIVDTEDIQTGDFDLEKQCLLKDTIAFKIYIENKKTFWRYRQKSENQIMVTKQEHPLTKNGKIEIEKTDVTPQPSDDLFFPNPTADSITKEEQEFYSEIFI